MIHFLAFISSYAYVGLRVLQTKNVVAERYKMIFITSLLIEVCSVTMVINIVQKGWISILALGLGGAFGSVSAVYFSKHYLDKKE